MLIESCWNPSNIYSHIRNAALGAMAAALLCACGGGTDSATDGKAVAQQEGQAEQTLQVQQAPLATGVTTLHMTLPVLSAEAAAQVAQPHFHLAPVLLPEPDDTDAVDNATSAGMTPRSFAVRAELHSLRTRGLTVQTLQAVGAGTATPNSSSGSVSTYSPAQIRAAYGMPALPPAGTSPTATQAAQLGAGQTIYLIDAMSDPNIAAELAAFNQKFGLPTCSTQVINTGTGLPLLAAPTSGCTFSVVNTNSSGKIVNTTAPYDSGWATEIALDVQWAHATAPMARIILINTPDASTGSFTGAVSLANAMGAGSVSMSFGAQEGSWTSSADSVFTGNGMTYLASAGDSGPSVQWPAVSPNVVAVGGTTLTYSGSGNRSETTWSDTGGGVSQFTATPSYQNNTVPGITTLAHRSVSDVAFNANPNSGQYVAIMPSGSSNVQWVSAGGTSIGSPQWAGLFAVANAMRALSSKPVLGDPHATLYDQIGAASGSYASNFLDVTQGSNGSCNTCTAKVGYDQVTGLGTPNAGSLLTTLSGAGVAASAPVIASAGVSGTVGTALTFTVSVTNSNPVTFSLSGAPNGMTINSAGTVTWTTPVAGSYAVTVTAKDSKTGLTGSGIYTVTIAGAKAPVVNSASIAGKAGTALSYTVSVSDSNSVTYSLSGAPSGMSISSAGVISWAKPVAGTYAVTVTAKDGKTGLSGSGVLTLNIASTSSGSSTSPGPVVTTSGLSGTAGAPLVGSISVSDPGVSALSLSISNAPLGMMFYPGGSGIAVLWNNPVAGSYSLKISVVDSAGHSLQTTIPVAINAH
jgi:subtilase family serine protease